MIGFECIHTINNRRMGKGVVVMKLDMSKAYGRVEWSYLKGVMEKVDFCNRWIELIMRCVESVSVSVLLNGVPRQTFKSRRGLRQGNPLSLYLFLFSVEYLSDLLLKEEHSRHYSGFCINNHCPSITHLFFFKVIVRFFQSHLYGLKRLQDR